MQHNLQDNYCKVFDKYREEQGEAATAKDVARWAIREGHVEVPEDEQVALLAKRFQSAWAGERIKDKQGRTVRRKHAAEKMVTDEEGTAKQTFFWDNVEDATYEHMVLSYSKRRVGIRNDAESLRTDVDSYNENWLPRGKMPIQMSFNFDEDDADGVA